MDDLEEIWGPRGRATVDPGSVRAVAPPAGPGGAVSDGLPPGSPASSLRPAHELLPPPPPPPPPPPWPQAPATSGVRGEIVPAATSASRPPHVPAIVAGTVALVVAVVAIVVASRPPDRPAPVATTAGTTATTIVSAAADLLGRSKVTAPEGATTSSVAAVSSPAPAAPIATPTTMAPATPSRPAPASTVGLPPLAQAEHAAGQFIEILQHRDCDGLWAMLSRGTQAFLTGDTEPGEPSGRDALCDGLRSEETIPPMRVHGPAEWRGDGAVVPLESEGEVEELALVAEDGRWVIDLFGDFNEES